MFSFLKSKRFEPNFPIIDIFSTPEEAYKVLSGFAAVNINEEPEQEEVDLEYEAENEETRIHVCISNGQITYVNYLTSLFNNSDKQKAQKLRWFLEYYGGVEEFQEPQDTGYMVFCRNQKKNITVVLGLHMGPIRINRH